MHYVKDGSSFRPFKEENIDVHEVLPPGNYIIKSDAFGNLFFESIASFEIPSKLYGDTTLYAERILNTYQLRGSSTGVLLTGEKGSGKTLLAKVISCLGHDLNYPTVVINTPFCGDKFNELIQGITQPCVVLFDEFEKVYDREKQQEILTLLDGVFPTKKLFLFTVNDKWGIDIHMHNRPGRIFYALDYSGLETGFITDYCNENLLEELKVHIPVLCQIATMFYAFNFDMLKAIVEEMNRYKESPPEVLKFINASPIGENDTNSFSVSLVVGGEEISVNDLEEKEITVNPLNLRRKLWVQYDIKDIVEAGREGFTSDDLKRVDTIDGRFIFINPEKSVLTLTKVKKVFSYTGLLA